MMEYDTYYSNQGCTSSRYGLPRCVESAVLTTPSSLWQQSSRRDNGGSHGSGSCRPPNGTKQPKMLYNILMHENKFNYEQPPANSRDGNFTSSTYPSALSEMYQMWSANGDFLTPSRPRSKSMGNAGWRLHEVASASMPTNISRTPSRDSLASYDESVASDEGTTRWSFGSVRSDLEVARSKLMKLTTKSDSSPVHNNEPEAIDNSRSSHSQPGSPPSVPTYRKYSDCSSLMRSRRLAHHATAAPSSTVTAADHNGPVDLSCKKKKFECTSSLPYSRRIPAPAAPVTIRNNNTSSASLDEGIDDDTSSDGSILKSILTGRVRSNSMSVVSGKRPTIGGGNGVELDISRQLLRRRVTLAKKNLLPVIARITDLLIKIADFVRVLPCFQELPVSDQKALLANACPRLLLLDMAKSHVEFAVTAIHRGGSSAQLTEEEVLKDEGPATNGNSQTTDSNPDSEIPTQQFVETVRNFIRKCQTFGITSEEYLYMRMITLFQLGAGTLERADLADAINAEARQRLQEVVHRTHPTEKLRYSTLLLALHTLFGIHCGMLQALLFRPIPKAGTFDEFVWNALNGGGVEVATG